MAKFLLINGPNLNFLGGRDPALYGTRTMRDIEEAVRARGLDLDVEIDVFQSNHVALPAVASCPKQQCHRNVGVS